MEKVPLKVIDILRQAQMGQGPGLRAAAGSEKEVRAQRLQRAARGTQTGPLQSHLLRLHLILTRMLGNLRDGKNHRHMSGRAAVPMSRLQITRLRMRKELLGMLVSLMRNSPCILNVTLTDACMGMTSFCGHGRIPFHRGFSCESVFFFEISWLLWMLINFAFLKERGGIITHGRALMQGVNEDTLFCIESCVGLYIYAPPLTIYVVCLPFQGFNPLKFVFLFKLCER